MKRIGLVIALLAAAGSVFAGIKVESDVNGGTAWGKTKAWADMPKEVTIGLFNVNYMTTRVAAAKAGTGISQAAITLRAEFDLSDADAQAVTDEAFAYLKQKLEGAGYKVNVHDAEALKASKNFQKYSKKDPTAVVNTGGPTRVTTKDKVDERIATYANGVPGAYLGANPGPGGMGYTQLAIELGGADGRLTLNVVGTVDFTEALVKESKANTLDDYNRASVDFKPKLRLIDDPKMGGQSAMSIFSSKVAGGKVFGGNVYAYEGAEWIESDGMDQDSIWRHKVKPEGFKQAAGELLKAYVDQLVARFDAAKTAGK